MAKICINCGVKVGLLGNSYKLVYEDAVFCSDCMDEASKLLFDIKVLTDKGKYKKVEEAFKDNLRQFRLREEAKRTLESEFYNIASEFSDFSRYNVKRFQGGFEESYQAIAKAGMKVTCNEETLYEPPVIKLGDAKVATFVFEQYFFRNGSYASLTVTLVNSKGISIVTAAGSGGGNGVLNISWGAEEDFVSDFWQIFRTMNPQFKLEEWNELSHE